MRYRSNLAQPEITGFTLRRNVKQILGHDAPSDPDFEPECTFWTHDEAAILYHIAKSRPGHWLDIGARFGWTAAHLIAAGSGVTLVDPILIYALEVERLRDNLRDYRSGAEAIAPVEADEFFGSFFDSLVLMRWDGFVIDGNHDSPFPLNDAKNCRAHAKENSVIVFHDTWGEPIRDGVNWLIENGWKCRVYDTPNGVAVCWRDPLWTPPDHVPDPAIDWAHVRQHRAPEFDFTKTI